MVDDLIIIKIKNKLRPPTTKQKRKKCTELIKCYQVAILATNISKRKKLKRFLYKITPHQFLIGTYLFAPRSPPNNIWTLHRLLWNMNHVSIQPEQITGSKETCSSSKNFAIWMSYSWMRIISMKLTSRCLPLWGTRIRIPQLGPTSNGRNLLLFNRRTC